MLRWLENSAKHCLPLSLVFSVVAFFTGLSLIAPAHYSYAEPISKKVLLLGDSIGAGYGLNYEDSWAHGLESYLAACDISLVNASVSGETSAGGLRRLPDLLERQRPTLLIVELGGNDGLRGYPLKKLQGNLRSIIDLAQQYKARAYVLGMRIPPNYGPKYSDGFHSLYAAVATETESALLPFLLEGIGDRRELMQSDGIHPSADAQAEILTAVLKNLPAKYQCTSAETVPAG